MAFKDIRMPDCYNLDVRVTRSVRSDDVTALSGDIYPNQKWAFSRRQFRLTWGPKKLADIDTFIAFWEVVKTTHTFRVRDEQDYRSAAHGSLITDTDQVIGIGDGVQSEFQLVKNYTYSGEQNVQPVFAPVDGTLLIAVDGVAQTETTDYTVDTSTGLVTFIVAPANAVLVSAGFEYDVKVRFEEPALTHRFKARHLAEIDTFTLVENPR